LNNEFDTDAFEWSQLYKVRRRRRPGEGRPRIEVRIAKVFPSGSQQRYRLTIDGWLSVVDPEHGVGWVHERRLTPAELDALRTLAEV
jgi:hypothetical protein